MPKRVSLHTIINIDSISDTDSITHRVISVLMYCHLSVRKNDIDDSKIGYVVISIRLSMIILIVCAECWSVVTIMTNE